MLREPWATRGNGVWTTEQFRTVLEGGQRAACACSMDSMVSKQRLAMASLVSGHTRSAGWSWGLWAGGGAK
jgi:hypothetical protein